MPDVSNISLNLESLLKLSNSLNASKDTNFILNSALLSLMGKLRMIRAGVYLPSPEDSSQFIVSIHKGKIKNSTFKLPSEDLLIKRENTSCCIEELHENGYEYLFKVQSNEKTFALICLGNRITSVPLSSEELQYAELVCQIAAAAMNNALSFLDLQDTSTNLIKQNQLLHSIFEMSRDFTSLHSRDQIIRLLSYRLMGQLMVSKFCMYLRDENRNYNLVVNRFDSQLPDNALDEIFQIEHSVMMKHVNFSHSIYQEINKIKVKAFVPMIVQGQKKGFLCVGKKLNGEEFTDDNLMFMEALSNRAIAAIENERLFREELEKKKLESELNLALEIQQNLLPMDLPELSSEYSIAGESLPSRMVGGDYFDFIPLSDGRLLIAIADVSGKGMPAALLMANVQAALRALAPLSLTLKDLVLRINSIVYKNTTPDKFVTFFVGIINTESHYFNYINAGHNPPIVLRKDGSQELLSEGGLILGIFDDGIAFSEGEIDMSSGDLICFYTDGITESPSPEGEEFGEQRLIECLIEKASLNADLLLKNIIRQVAEFSNSDNRYDDLTAVVLKRS